jgi:hypothetical protein
VITPEAGGAIGQAAFDAAAGFGSCQHFLPIQFPSYLALM